MGPLKTHLSAVVAVPPADLWEPIQAIRRIHDRHIRDWMPHVTLLYPFWPAADFDEAARRLADLPIAPFEVTLASVRFFAHSPQSFTVWLSPDPTEPWMRLHEELVRRFPDCADTSNYEGGFSPHLSLGQSRTPDLAGRLQADWRPLRFEMREIALIRREEREPFQVDRAVPLRG